MSIVDWLKVYAAGVTLVGLFLLVGGWRRSVEKARVDRLPQELFEPVEMNSVVPPVTPMWDRYRCELCQVDPGDQPAALVDLGKGLSVHLCDSCRELGAEHYTCMVVQMTGWAL